MKAVIFDMDGVLVDSMKYHIYAWKRAFKEFGLEIPESVLYSYEGADFKRTIKHFGEKYDFQFTQEQKDQIYANKLKYTREVFKVFIYDYIQDIVKLIHDKGLKLCVVTGSNREFTEKVVNEKFDNMFEFLVTSGDVEKSKPAPDPYLKAIEKLNLPIDEIVVIENAPLGVESAKRAGLKVFALETTIDRHYLGNADKIFTNHKELFDYFKEIFRSS